MILVTGATGILGRVLVLELLKQGKKVRATKRKNSNLDEMKTSLAFYTDSPEEYFHQIQWMDTDFEDIYSLQNALLGIDEVYHCAAKVSFHPKNEKQLYKTNIDGTKNLIYACENSSVKKFLFVSSIAVLDGLNDNGMMDEQSNFNPKIAHSAYSVSKHLAEMEVWRASAEGLKTVIVNPGLIIGSGNWHKSSGTLFKDLGENSFTFSGGTSYVDVRDVARISILLMDQNIFGERFILISDNKRYREVSHFLHKSQGKSPAKIVPHWVLNFGVFLNAVLGWLIPALQMVNHLNVKSISEFNEISNEKIKDRLKYQFIPVEESLQIHLNNYLQQKK